LTSGRKLKELKKK